MTLPAFDSLEQLRAENQRLQAENQRLRAQIGTYPVPHDHSDIPLSILSHWFDAVSDAVFVTDPDLRILYWNRAAEAIYGWSSAAVVGRPAHHVIGVVRYLGDASFERVLEILTSTGAWRGEFVQRTRDGREVTIEGSIRAMFDEQGAITGYIAVNRDVTQRMRLEDELRASEERFRAIIENGTEGVAILDIERQMTYISPNVIDMLGIPQETAQSIDPLTLTHPEDQSRLRQFVDELFAEAHMHGQLTVRMQHDSGDWRWIELHMVNLLHHPAVQSVIVNFSDVTERVLATRMVQDQARVLDHAQVMVRDMEHRIVLWTSGAEQLYGYKHDEAIGRVAYELLRTTFPEPLEHITAALNEHGRWSGILVQRTRDDQVVIVASQWILDRAADGRPYRIITANTDITQRIQTEAALLQAETRFASVFHSSPAGLAISRSSDGLVLDVNESFLRLTGYSRDEAFSVGFRLLDLVTDPNLRGELERRIREEGRLSNHEMILRDRQGELRTVLASFEPMLIDGEACMITTCLDITDRVRAEQALIAEHERVVRLKNEFLATMSHELRTPLNAILGHTELLSEEIYGPLQSRQKTAVNHINESGRHLLALINDILDYTKLESGNFALDMTTIDLADLCHESVRMVADAARRKRQSITIMLDGVFMTIQADPVRLKQILTNLISNAVKFTPDGGAIDLEVHGDSVHKQVTLRVCDTGIGIAEADLARMFQPFTQLDGRLSRQYEGTGLGLALVRRLAAAHGGSIAVESTPGKGSCFSVTLPWVAPPERQKPLEPPAVPKVAGEQETPLTILLVEDQVSNVMVMNDLLDAAGYRLVVANDGGEAMKMARETLPALILMDIQLPGASGLEVIQWMRADHELRHIPIIVLTALVLPGDRERCIAAGADEYLPKPINIAVLRTTIANWITRTHAV